VCSNVQYVARSVLCVAECIEEHLLKCVVVRVEEYVVK
jgi:hypothetical protein